MITVRKYAKNNKTHLTDFTKLGFSNICKAITNIKHSLNKIKYFMGEVSGGEF